METYFGKSKKMAPLRIIIRILILLLIIDHDLSFEYEDSSSDNRDGLIQEAVKSLLGVRDIQDTRNTTKKRLPSPPRYMLDLYDQYKTGKVPTQGNTVRSILPMHDSVDGVDMLVFNLTGIHTEERIIQSILHVYKRRRSRSKKKRPKVNYKLKILDLTADSNPQSIDLLLRQKQGWFSYDVTDAVIKCRSIKNVSDYLLGVTAEVQRPNGKKRPVFLRRIVRQSSQPFLIIFSEDQTSKPEIKNEEETTQNLVDELLRNKIWNNTEFNKSIVMDDILSGRIGRSLPEGYEEKYHSILQSVAETESKLLRKVRSLPSNEVGDIFNSSHLSEEDKLLLKYTRKVDPNIIPVPPNTRPTKKHPWRKKKNRRRNRKLPFWWIKHEGKHVTHNTDKVCQRRKLVVDFSKIGWSQWIIAPSTFDAYYCTGSCSFPLIKSGKPSNHATIQSLIQVLTKSLDVPAPCCIPSSTSSLTMLYVDENDRVVLKNYPNMIVENCACR